MKSAARLLQVWFGRHGRDLPWRRTHDPYRVLLAEFILQQTRMETGLRYYARLLELFPSLGALAQAREEDVLAAWSGLGYYSRARNLHACAKRIRVDHGGIIPSDVALLRELPGIGPYTAGAIASIAYDRPEPSLDGNQFRVLGRFLGLRDPRRPRARRRVEALARSWLQEASPRVINQALMDLGSQVCLPSSPRCGECPISPSCRSAGIPGPARKARASATPVEFYEARLHRRDAHVWLAAPSPEGLLARLWLPPLHRRSGLKEWDVEHRFSHRVWRIRIRLASGAPKGRGRWVAPEDLGRLPHASLTRRILQAANGLGPALRPNGEAMDGPWRDADRGSTDKA